MVIVIEADNSVRGTQVTAIVHSCIISVKASHYTHDVTALTMRLYQVVFQYNI